MPVRDINIKSLNKSEFDLVNFKFRRNKDGYIELLDENYNMINMYHQHTLIDLACWLISTCNQIEDINIFNESNMLEGNSDVNETRCDN